MSRAIKEVTEALNQPQILATKVSFLRDPEEQDVLRRRFYSIHNFPGILGIIDCTHVAIVSPRNNDPLYPEHVYVNRKNYHSLNVQLICDPDLKIMNVNSRFSGSAHDSFIWAQSPIHGANIQKESSTHFFLLGDSGYSTRPWLLTPLLNPGNHGEELFNERLSSVRTIIERCNGVLKNRFRCLLRYRTLQ
ncbi:unnamed protein product [Acanthoscelides obtectus]|nr:unnamed protein product [Acanthoscelides obtectus]CAK1651381.1 Putative nuclease HARBI1 [Acanthoscelides obtectus]